MAAAPERFDAAGMYAGQTPADRFEVTLSSRSICRASAGRRSTCCIRRAASCARAPGPFLCEGCVEGLPRADGRRCEVCWLPLRHAWFCYACEEHPSALTGLRSVFRYEGDVRRLVHAFKFGGQSCLAEALSQQLYEAYEQHELEVDAIAAVPLTGRTTANARLQPGSAAGAEPGALARTAERGGAEPSRPYGATGAEPERRAAAR